jgi:hypothetical protein
MPWTTAANTIFRRDPRGSQFAQIVTGYGRTTTGVCAPTSGFKGTTVWAAGERSGPTVGCLDEWHQAANLAIIDPLHQP